MTYSPPMYCADVPGTLFDSSNWGWDVSRLDSLLSRTLKKKGITLAGVNSSYLYFGMWRSLFAWHTEDLDLYSVNYLHYGAPKFWYAVAPEDRERFEILAQGMVPEMWRHCPEFLRHKELLISPTLLEQNGIPFTKMMQHPGEFVVTYPGSYHSGFNVGFNCAESCNFATEEWVEIGEEAGICECRDDSVRLDMSIFDDNVCARVDEDDYTAVKRGRCGAPRREPTRGGAAAAAAARGGKAATGRDRDERVKPTPLKLPSGRKAIGADVLVPEGWKRTVVKRPAGTLRKNTPDADRDTFYRSPDGKTLKSKHEVTKYLGSNPSASHGVTVKDFFFETTPSDAPPARLLAPATPSPASSEEKKTFGGGGRSTSGGAKRKPSTTTTSAQSKRRVAPKSKATKLNASKSSGGVGKKSSSTATPKTKSKRESLSGFLSPLKLFASSSGAAKQRNEKTGKVPMSRTERAAAVDVAPETFKKYKQAGLLENAITDVLRRAGAVGKAVRGSSLVMQVEQALGVGSGTLRSHGNQIQTMSRTLSRRVK